MNVPRRLSFRSAGVTLIELLAVIGVLIILAGLALVAGNTARTRAYNTQAQVCGEQIRKAQTLYYSEQQAFADTFEKLDEKMVARCAMVSVIEVDASAGGYTYTVAHTRGNAKYTITDDKGATTALAAPGAVNGAAATDTSGGGQVVGPIPPLPTSSPSDPFSYLTLSFSANALGQLDSRYQTAACAVVTAGGQTSTLIGRYGRSSDRLTLKLNKGSQAVTMRYYTDLACTQYLMNSQYPMAFRPQGATTVTSASPWNSGYNAFTVNLTQDMAVTLENNANSWGVGTRWVYDDGSDATSNLSTQQPFYTVSYSDHAYPMQAMYDPSYLASMFILYPGQAYSQAFIEVNGGMAGQYNIPGSATPVYVWDDPSAVPGNFNHTSWYYGQGRTDPVWGAHGTTVRVAPQGRPYVRVTNPGLGRVVDVPIVMQVYGLNLRTYLKPKPGTRPMGLTAWSSNVLTPVAPYLNTAIYHKNMVDADGNPMSGMTSAQGISATASPPAIIPISSNVRYVLETPAPVTLTTAGPQVQERTFEYRRDELISGNWVETP